MYSWNFDGVKIFKTVEAKLDTNTLVVSGTGVNEQVTTGKDILVTPFSWSAMPLENGWYVWLMRANGKVGEWQGSTFSLPAEIATAVRRLL